MIELNKNMEEHIYDMYLRKNQAIIGSGYEVPKEELFSPGKYELLEDSNKLLLFFSKGHMRQSQNIFFSNLLLFDESLLASAQQSIEQYLADNGVNSFVFAVEDYLSTELRLLNQLSVEWDHVAIRMINDDIRRVVAPPFRKDLTIRPFKVENDEPMFVDIFNKTFAKLCEPTTFEEIEQWTHSPRFSPDHYLFAVNDGITLGFIAIEINTSMRTSYIQEIGVIEEEKGKGVSGQLMYTGIRSVLGKGVTKMGVGVSDWNTVAINFFAKWKFKELYRRIFTKGRM